MRARRLGHQSAATVPSPHSDGAGIGGGVYLAGPGSTASGTVIFGNTASTSNKDLYGQFGAG
jgi:hypothetical protein